MPFFRSLPEDAGPPEVFRAYPQLYRLWSEMSQELMNGPSPLSPAERELVFAFAAGTAGCDFVFTAHSEIAYAWGVEDGLVDQLLHDLETAPVQARTRALLRYVRKLTLTPGEMSEADADTVLAAGWDEHALHDAIAITGRMRFMQCLVEGYGFTPWAKNVAREHAEKRVKLGYVGLYPELSERKLSEQMGSPTVEAVPLADQATDERVICLRIYADSKGETHMQEKSFALLPKQVFKDNHPLHLSETLASSGCSFCRVPAGMREVGWHNPPRRKLVIWLTGEVEFETSDGDVRRLAAGSVVLAEDTTGKGHISRHPPDGQFLMFIDLE